jgi:hypothetical protein
MTLWAALGAAFGAASRPRRHLLTIVTSCAYKLLLTELRPQSPGLTRRGFSYLVATRSRPAHFKG